MLMVNIIPHCGRAHIQEYCQKRDCSYISHCTGVKVENGMEAEKGSQGQLGNTKPEKIKLFSSKAFASATNQVMELENRKGGLFHPSSNTKVCWAIIAQG